MRLKTTKTDLACHLQICHLTKPLQLEGKANNVEMYFGRSSDSQLLSTRHTRVIRSKNMGQLTTPNSQLVTSSHLSICLFVSLSICLSVYLSQFLFSLNLHICWKKMIFSISENLVSCIGNLKNLVALLKMRVSKR